MGWERVEIFKKHLHLYKERTGKLQREIAADLGTTYGNLRFWLSGRRAPKLANLKKIAKVFGTSILDYTDDPGSKPMGVDVSNLSERDCVLARMMFDDYTSGDLTTEGRKHLYDSYQLNKSQLRDIKARKP